MVQADLWEDFLWLPISLANLENLMWLVTWFKTFGMVAEHVKFMTIVEVMYSTRTLFIYGAV
jgi:hypothetical protein